MKKKILFAFMALATSFSLVSCGSDDDDKDDKVVYLVKSISCTDEDDDVNKYEFEYENGKLTKVTHTKSYDSSYLRWDGITYSSATSFTATDQNGEELLGTMDASNNTIVYCEDEDDEATFSYAKGYLTKEIRGEKRENPYVMTRNYEWEKGNITKITFEDNESERNSQEATITYSGVDNTTNFDLLMWVVGEDWFFTTQFIKNVSSKVPSSVSIEGRDFPITTTLDEKGRLATMEYDELIFTFEYFE